jgi:hypothetical protein
MRPSASTVPASSRQRRPWALRDVLVEGFTSASDQGVEPAPPELAVVRDAIGDEVLLFGAARDGDAIRHRRQRAAAEQGKQIVQDQPGRHAVHDGMVEYEPEESLVPLVDLDQARPEKGGVGEPESFICLPRHDVPGRLQRRATIE